MYKFNLKMRITPIRITVLMTLLAFTAVSLGAIFGVFKDLSQLISYDEVLQEYISAGDDVPVHIYLSLTFVYGRILDVLSHSVIGLGLEYPNLFHMISAFFFVFLLPPNFFSIYAVVLILASICMLLLIAYFALKEHGNIKAVNAFLISLAIVIASLNFYARILQSLNDGNYPDLTIRLLFFEIILFLFLSKNFPGKNYSALLKIYALTILSFAFNYLGAIWLTLFSVILSIFYLNELKKMLSLKNIIKLIPLLAISSLYIMGFLKDAVRDVLPIVLMSNQTQQRIVIQKISLADLSEYSFLNPYSLFFYLFVLSILSIYFYRAHERKLLVLNVFLLANSALAITGVFAFRILRILPMYLSYVLLLDIFIVYLKNIRKINSQRAFTRLLISVFIIMLLAVAYGLSSQYKVQPLFSISMRIDDAKAQAYVDICHQIRERRANLVSVYYPYDIWLPYVCYKEYAPSVKEFTFYIHNFTAVITFNNSQSSKFYILWWDKTAEVYFGAGDPIKEFYFQVSYHLRKGDFFNATYVDYLVVSTPYKSQWYHQFSTEIFNYLDSYKDNICEIYQAKGFSNENVTIYLLGRKCKG